MKKGRKLILARNDLIEEAAKFVARDGRTLFSFTNEVFEWAIEAYKMQVAPSECLEFYKMMTLGKKLGYVVVPSDIFDHMTRELYEVKCEELLREWYLSGVYTGNYFAIKFSKQNLVDVLKKFIKMSFWNIDEFYIDVQDGEVDLKSFSRNLAREFTAMLAKFLEGVFYSWGYTVKANKLLQGMIMMKLKKVEGEEKQFEVLLESEG